MFGAGALWLERNVAFVNSLNVFPVPDGDTGTNMLLTMQAAIQEARRGSLTNAGAVAGALSHGALLGARGNSGVILSQIMRGFARALDKRPTLDAPLFADALVEGARTAYKGVVKPVEGTILTVIREAADGAVVAAAGSDDIAWIVAKTAEAARAAVIRTPQLLPVLKEAGVVDAGGEGLALILEGVAKYLAGEALVGGPMTGGAQHLESFAREEGWGYDIQFHLRGKNLNVDEIRETISAMGESAIIVGDETLIKVHIHAPNPGDIIKYGAERGALSNVMIENMQEQYVDFQAGHTADQRIGAENLGAILPHQERSAAASTAATTGIATIAVTPGEGIRRIFESLGISATVHGGPTMNPSAQELLHAIDQVASNEIILLPNDKNIILAANQVKELTAKHVKVIPSRTVPEGLAALLAFNYQTDLESNLGIMTSAMERVRTIEITHATRAAHLNSVSVSQGQPIALVDGELVAAGEHLEPLILGTLHDAGAEDGEIITIYYGSQVTPAQAEEIRALVMHGFPRQEVEIYFGGQPLYPYILSIE